MENKVYYGEYSLSHWIELIKKENIILPWYQRSFVWDKIQIENLIKTLDNNQFIPPIVIGAVRENGEWKNYILDGQQRLTSILLAKQNKYIDKQEFLSQKPDSEINQLADDITTEEDDEIDEKIKIIKWNFKEIIQNKKINYSELNSSFYKQLFQTPRTDDFFDKHFLGFAYIKPNNDVTDDQQSKFYSDTFRNINVGGIKLTRAESRKSLYFLKESLKNYFAPKFIETIKIETSSRESGLMDFVKYLSIIAQYNGGFGTLQKYGGRDWEKNENYYHQYIMSVVNHNLDNLLKFNINYPNIPYTDERMQNLKTTISTLGIPKTYNSIIEMDMYFFGLINEIIFKNKEVNIERKDELKTEIDLKINKLKETENHKYNPNALKYLKARITTSLEVYSKYRK
ncbi:DUF262 domain-containing protein [Empedobacter brevis]|uniref:DUF262 domain-containing protein n=1 Tax=Empedobacter brevis TaxID=247 RepID=UPI003342E277